MKSSTLCCSSLLGIAMLWAAPTLAQDSTTVVVQPAEPTPPPSTVVVSNQPAPIRVEGTRPTYPGLIWGGVAIWGVAYSASILTAALANDVCSAKSSLCIEGREIMYVPVVGPFAAIGGVNGDKGTSTAKTMLAIDGAFQLGGLAMMVTGIVLSATSRPPRVTALERKLVVAPYATASSAGLGAIGRF